MYVFTSRFPSDFRQDPHSVRLQCRLVGGRRFIPTTILLCPRFTLYSVRFPSCAWYTLLLRDGANCECFGYIVCRGFVDEWKDDA